MTKTLIYRILKTTFGFDSFRPLQEEAISHVLSNKDVLLVLPTGGGKSMCYQLPALIKKGITVVVSPLIALMDDQVLALRANGINAHALHSNVEKLEHQLIYDSMLSADSTLIYMAPERLLSEYVLNFLEKQNVQLFAIDEAHCVSIWGNDFRPEYEKLCLLKKRFPGIPIVALTATADTATQKDIIDKLALQNPSQLVGSFERKNITVSSRPGSDRVKQMKRFINDDEAGIIYCLSRKNTENISETLQSLGYKAAYYHAGMSGADRKFVHNQFLSDKIKIVCATIAFGMGIDKSNIRWIIHYNMPKNIEGYYQEIGRCGRNGEEAKALLFFSQADVAKLRSFVEKSEAEDQFKIIQRQKLNRMWDYANSSNCRTNMILNYFGEFRDQPCGHCDNCHNPPEMINGKIIAQKALSAIYRTKESLTMRNLIDILRGSERSDLTRWGWDKIKTFGAGKDLSQEDWKAYLTQLVNLGYISIDYVNYSKLRLTPLSYQILFEGKEIDLSKFNWQGIKSQIKPKPIQEVKNYDVHLLRKLKSLRKKMAEDKGVPAFVIFNDASLREMAHYKPLSMLEFSNIKGVGEYKLSKFGSEFIDAIKDYGNS